MLAHLARWLRAAGHDTELAPPRRADRTIIAQALDEHRLLLTCDRRLQHPRLQVIRLPMAPLDTLAALLRCELGLDWLHAPFTRCLVDNRRLAPLPPERIHALPEPARRLGGPFTFCPGCRRVFWPGSHVRRMRARLLRWAAG